MVSEGLPRPSTKSKYLIWAAFSGGSRISPRMARQLPGWGGGGATYDYAKISRKLHEIKRIWAPGGCPSHPFLDPPMALFVLGGSVHDIHSPRFTSGATPLPVLMASIAASHFPHMCFSRGRILDSKEETSHLAVRCTTDDIIVILSMDALGHRRLC